MKKMTIMQKKIIDTSEKINRAGYLMAGGLVDITPDLESIMQRALVMFIEENEKNREAQERILQQISRLKRLDEKK